jgi:hypothetical protein
VASEDSERPYGRESRNHDPVDRDVDDRRLPTVGRIEPAVLVGLARSSRARPASPGPELGKMESRSASEAAHNGTLRSRRLSERRQQGAVLAPIRKKHRPFQSRPAHQNVVRSRCRSRRRQNQRQSDDRQYAHTGHVPQLHRRKPRGSPGISPRGSRRRYVTRGVTASPLQRLKLVTHDALRVRDRGGDFVASVVHRPLFVGPLVVDIGRWEISIRLGPGVAPIFWRTALHSARREFVRCLGPSTPHRCGQGSPANPWAASSQRHTCGSPPSALERAGDPRCLARGPSRRGAQRSRLRIETN